MDIISSPRKKVTNLPLLSPVNPVLGLLFLVALLRIVVGPRMGLLTFQSPPRVPKSWVASVKGGKFQFGALTIGLPPGFTDQKGALVHGDVLVDTLFIQSQSCIPGSEIAVGIFPPNDQLDFQQPIEIRITVDATQATGEQLTMLMYSPKTDTWVEISSEFDEGTSQIVAFVRSFKPLPRDGGAWEARTLFAVFEKTLAATPTLPPTATGTPLPPTRTRLRWRRICLSRQR